MAIILNEDFENFMVHYPPEDMNEEGLRKQVRGYFQDQTAMVLFNVNAQRAYFASKVYDPIWKNINRGEDGKYYHRKKDAFSKVMPVLRNALQAKKLYEEVGNEAFAIRMDECRKHGGKGGISVRMNDIHLCTEPESPLHSDLWYENPQWRLERYLYPEVAGMDGTGLDYGVKEVREKVKSFIEELFELFDMDVMELDWMRTPPFFQEGCEEKNAHFLEEIVAFASEKRREAEKLLAHKISLAVRVPSTPEETFGAGLDITSWVKKGYIDIVIPCAFVISDGMIPLKVWKALLGENIELIPGLDSLSTTFEGNVRMYNTPALVCGYAASFYHYGVKDLYLFNHMDSLVNVIGREAYEEILRCAGNKERAEHSYRRHLASPCRNLVPGFNTVSALPLPAGISFRRLRLEVGGNFAGRKKLLVMAFDCKGEKIRAGDVECVLNGKKCSLHPEEKDLPQLPENTWQIFVFSIPEDSLQEGSNVAGFRLLREVEKVRLVWCEADILSGEK